MLLTLLLGWQASKLQPDASFEKMIPQEHPYIKLHNSIRDTFGGANNIISLDAEIADTGPPITD